MHDSLQRINIDHPFAVYTSLKVHGIGDTLLIKLIDIKGLLKLAISNRLSKHNFHCDANFIICLFQNIIPEMLYFKKKTGPTR